MHFMLECPAYANQEYHIQILGIFRLRNGVAAGSALTAHGLVEIAVAYLVSVS
jgi:hypothetical protein